MIKWCMEILFGMVKIKPSKATREIGINNDSV